MQSTLREHQATRQENVEPQRQHRRWERKPDLCMEALVQPDRYPGVRPESKGETSMGVRWVTTWTIMRHGFGCQQEKKRRLVGDHCNCPLKRFSSLEMNSRNTV